MLQVTVLMVGKTKEGFLRDGLAFYGQRLRPFLNLTLRSVREAKEAGKLSPAALKAEEGERLLAQIPPRAWVTALDPRGRECTTEDFAHWLTQRELAAQPLALVIGGHWGLDARVLTAAHDILALSRLTLTHELSRLVLLEQLYRAMTLKMGHPYHV